MILFRSLDTTGYKYYVYTKGVIKTLTFGDIVNQWQKYPEIKEIDVNSGSFILEDKNGVLHHSDTIPLVDSVGNLMNNAVSVIGVEKFGNIILSVRVVPLFRVSDWKQNRLSSLYADFYSSYRRMGSNLGYAYLQELIRTKGLQIFNGVFENGAFVPIFGEPNEIRVTQVDEAALELYNFYVDNSNRIIISGIKSGYQLKIPSHVYGLADFCFANTNIEQVKGANFVYLRVGNYSFSGCQNLRKAKFHLIDIKGTGAFKGCQNLQEVVFQHAASVGNCTFENCVGLREVHILKDTTACISFGDGVFAGCKDMTLDMHHGHLKECGNGVFYGAENIKVIADKSVLDSFGDKLMAGGKNIKLYYRETVGESRSDIYMPDRELNRGQLVLYKSNG